MKVKTYITLNREEIQTQIPYAVVCEVMSGSKWNTGKRKRLMKERFTEAEREKIYKLHKQAYSWHLKKGVPDELKLSVNTMLLWQKLANFCYEL
jgi:hypothetical protein